MRFPINTVPYVRLLKRLLCGRGSLQSVAHRQEILCPEEKVPSRPAFYSPEQIERITDYKATDPWSQTTKELEIAAAVSTMITHAPTIAYHIKDAVLYDGSIYVGGFRHRVGERSFHAGISSKPSHIKTGALASSYLGTKYFGHWLVDDCTKYLLAEEVGPPLCVSMMRSFEHQQKYEGYFGQDWTPTDRVRIDNLIVFQDFSQNSLKRNRYTLLRGRIKGQFARDGRTVCIYLKRGQTGAARTIVNEEQIVDALVKRSFMIIDVASDSLEYIIENLINAKIVVSMEGSHIAHCAFTVPEHSGLLVLQPPDRFSAVHRGWSECVGVSFGFVVGASSTPGYYFSVSEILRTIDLMLSKIGA